MEFSEKLEICCEQMALIYGIPELVASEIISDLNIEDIVFDYFEDAIKEAEEKQLAIWQEEIEDNPDLYRDDIHGGV